MNKYQNRLLSKKEKRNWKLSRKSYPYEHTKRNTSDHRKRFSESSLTTLHLNSSSSNSVINMINPQLRERRDAFDFTTQITEKL